MRRLEYEVKEIINETIDHPIKVDVMDFDKELASIGVNSIDLIKIVVAMEKKFGFTFDNEYLSMDKVENINNLLLYIQKNCLFE